MKFTEICRRTVTIGVPVMTLVITLLATLAASGVAALAFPVMGGLAPLVALPAVIVTAFVVTAPIAFALVRTIVRMDAQKRDLHAHQELLVATQRFARLGTWEYDARTRALTISDHLYELFGDPDRTRVVSIPTLLQMVHTADRKMLEEAITRILHAGSREQVEFRLTGVDGLERTLWITGVRILDADGTVVKAFGACQDISDHKAMQAALKESEDHYRHSVKLSPLITFTTDADGSNERIAKRWSEVTGLTLDVSNPLAWTSAVHPDDVAEAAEAWTVALATGENYSSEYRLQLANGAYKWLHARAAARWNAEGRIMRWYGTIEDINSRKVAEIELRRSEAFAQSILDNSADCVEVLDLEGHLQFMNTPGLRLMEIADFEQFRGKHWDMLWPKDAHEEIDDALQRALAGSAVQFTGYCPTAKGKPRWWDVCVSPVPGPDGAIVQLLCTSHDISQQHKSAAKLRHMALHDGLTGLPNRCSFRDELDRALATRADRAQTALLFLDLDEFKSVNDAYGHPAGDALLCEAARRLRSCVRNSEKIARFGGDEFAVLQTGVTDAAEVAALAERIISCLSAPYLLDGRLVVVGVSIGIAIAAATEKCPDNLLRNADIALYQAKADGRGVFRVYKPGMANTAQAAQFFGSDLRRALAASELSLQYQPLIDLQTLCVTGFEALIRWNHPVRGLIAPGDFIPFAEKTGLILEIGEWVLEEACHCAIGWPPEISISINISPAQFRDKGLVDVVSRALRNSGLSPYRLQLEITEAVLLQNSALTQEVLSTLRDLGIRIAMDDFGLGFSSLNYLRTITFDMIKIDRSFIADMPDNLHTSSIVHAVLDLGKTLGVSTTAEGVENEHQAEILRAMGCREGQGFLFSKAVDAMQIPALLDRLSTKGKQAAFQGFTQATELVA